MVANASQSMQDRVSQKLQTAFEPSHLDVINESHQHNVLPGSESHFKVVLVSDKFENKRMLARHREIYAILADELAGASMLLLCTLIHKKNGMSLPIRH